VDRFVRTSPTPASRAFRGSLASSGKVNLTSNWTWGWDALLISAATFFQDSRTSSLQARTPDPFGAALTEGTSQLWLAGRGERSYFDARTMYFKGFSTSDVQGELPVILPVIDYTKGFDQKVFGGEVSLTSNFTSLTRDSASFDAISANATASALCTTATADPAVKIPANCLLRGIPGSYTRFTAEAQWQRQFTDPLGQVWKPFASL